MSGCLGVVVGGTVDEVVVVVNSDSEGANDGVTSCIPEVDLSTIMGTSLSGKIWLTNNQFVIGIRERKKADANLSLTTTGTNFKNV